MNPTFDGGEYLVSAGRLILACIAMTATLLIGLSLMVARGQRPAARDQRPEARGQRPEARSQRPAARGQNGNP